MLFYFSNRESAQFEFSDTDSKEEYTLWTKINFDHQLLLIQCYAINISVWLISQSKYINACIIMISGIN